MDDNMQGASGGRGGGERENVAAAKKMVVDGVYSYHRTESYQNSLMQGKKTMWCCLSCGIPFTFPDDAANFAHLGTIREFGRFVHYVQRSVRDDDLGQYQWNMHACSLLGKGFLGGGDEIKNDNDDAIIREVRKDKQDGLDMASVKTFWGDVAYPRLMESIIRPTNNIEDEKEEIAVEEDVSELARTRVLLCQGCLILSRIPSFEIQRYREGALNPLTGGAGISQAFFFSSFMMGRNNGGDDGTMTAAVVSASAHILMILFHMHRLVCQLQISRGSGSSSPSSTAMSQQMMTESRIWRMENLLRLYSGFLIFSILKCTRTAQPSTVDEKLTFHEWYMFRFRELDLLELPPANDDDDDDDNTSSSKSFSHFTAAIWQQLLSPSFTSSLLSSSSSPPLFPPSTASMPVLKKFTALFQDPFISNAGLSLQINILAQLFSRIVPGFLYVWITDERVFINGDGSNALSPVVSVHREYHSLQNTYAMKTFLSNSDIPWVPAAIHYGLDASTILQGLHIGLQNHFRMHEKLKEVILDYLGDCLVGGGSYIAGKGKKTR